MMNNADLKDIIDKIRIFFSFFVNHINWTSEIFSIPIVYGVRAIIVLLLKQRGFHGFYVKFLMMNSADSKDIIDKINSGDYKCMKNDAESLLYNAATQRTFQHHFSCICNLLNLFYQ